MLNVAAHTEQLTSLDPHLPPSFLLILTCPSMTLPSLQSAQIYYIHSIYTFIEEIRGISCGGGNIANIS